MSKVIKDEKGKPIKGSCGDEIAYKLAKRDIVLHFRENPTISNKELLVWAQSKGHDSSDIADIIKHLNYARVFKKSVRKKYTDDVEISIKCNRAAADSMLPLIRQLQVMGGVGSSRSITIEDYDGKNRFGFDGDGPDNIESIKLDGELVKSNMEKAMEKSAYTKRTGTPGNYKYYYGPVKGRRKRKVKAATTIARERGRGTQGTLPHDIHTLTVDNATSLIKQAVKMPLKTLRRNQDIVEQQKEKAYEQKNYKALDRLEVMGDIYTAAVDIKEFKDATPKGWAEEIVRSMKSHMEGNMEKSGISLVIFPGELTKAAKLSGVGAKHPAGLSSVGGKTKSMIPYTSHTKRMAFAKMAAERMLAPKPESEGKYADTPEVDRKGREKDQKPPGSVGSTGVSGMESQASDNFGRETVIVSPTDIGAGRPESASKYGGVKKVPRKS